MKKISIVGSCYNENENVTELVERITAVMEAEKYNYEIILADNASTDGTADTLRELAKRDRRLKAILNNRNYGPRLSPRNALRHCDGDAVITIATDLQDPPELIPLFLREWEKGYPIVMGRKTGSEEGKIMYQIRHLYYNILQCLSEKKIIKHASGVSLMDRKVSDEIKMLDLDVSFQFIIPEMGYPISFIPYTQKRRKGGQSSYSFFKYFSYFVNSLISTSSAPLTAAIIFGLIVAFASMIIGIVYVVLKLKYWDMFHAGIAPLIIGVFFLGGIQISLIGLIGRYVSLILNRVTKQLPVIEKELINFESSNEELQEGEEED